MIKTWFEITGPVSAIKVIKMIRSSITPEGGTGFLV